MGIAAGPFGQERRLHRTGSDCIYPHAHFCVLERRGLRHAVDCVLRGPVQGPTGVAI